MPDPRAKAIGRIGRLARAAPEPTHDSAVPLSKPLSRLRPASVRASKAAASLLLAAALAGCQTATVLSPQTGERIAVPAAVTPFIGAAVERGRSELVIDAVTGRVLHQEDPDGLRFPASLTKLMTLHLLFEAVEAGRLSLDTPLLVSADAASRPPAKIGVEAGTTISVREAIQALAIRSANDVAAVVAENLAGSEPAFAVMMTQRARALGMNSTRFANASGLPDPAHVTSARDIARLAQSIRTRFPAYAEAFKTREFHYGGRRFEATNKLLGTVPGVDGLKTGYTRVSGFQLVATATRGGRSVIVVVMGGATGAERDARVTALIEEYLPQPGGAFSMFRR